MRIESIKINGLETPIGYALEDPVLSWILLSEDGDPPVRGEEIAWRVEVASDAGFADPVYVSVGKDLRPSGQRLGWKPEPRTVYYVRVSALGKEGRTLAIGMTEAETGCGGAPRGEWITSPVPLRSHPTFRKTFRVDLDRAPLSRARLYITAAGTFEACLNGKVLGDEYLAPFLSDERDALQVLTLRMEPEAGENRLEVTVGNGWYAGRYGLGDAGVSAGRVGRPLALLAEIVLEYADGRRERVSSGDDWEVFPSGILSSDIYDGEVQDERARDPEAATYAVPARKETLPDQSVLCDRYSPPLKIKKILTPARLIRTPCGEDLLDMGQNMVGFLSFDADLPAGTRVTIEYGEILRDGCFYRDNYRTAKAEFVWTSAGAPARVTPHFTYCGFRYARITGRHDLTPDAFRGCVVGSSFEETGEFSCGHEGVNRLHENIVWSMRGNFFDLPTDCPQRDERLGWTGDAMIFAPCAVYLGDVRAFFDKFLRELEQAQARRGGGVPNYLPDLESEIGGVSSVWGDAAVFLPMTLWWQYGDRERLARHYPMMRAWIGYVERLNGWKNDPEIPRLCRAGFHFGDWLALDGVTPDSMRGGTDEVFVASAWFYGAVRATAVAAEVLEKHADAEEMTALGDAILASIREEYFTPGGRLAVDTQAGYLLALRFGLAPDRDRLLDGFEERLRRDRYRVKCGFAAAPALCETLADVGRVDLAYDFLLSEKDPSWLRCVNLGATTVWERWNSVGPDGKIRENGMNSLNHYAFGAVGQFLYAHVAGIRPVEPGFTKALLAPEPDARLGHVHARYRSVAGTWGVDWTIDGDGLLTVDLEIPLLASADVVLPARDGEDEDRYVLSLGAGEYHFVYRPKRDYLRLYHEKTTLETLAVDERAVAIFNEKVPTFGAMLKNREDPELGALRLSDLPGMTYIPHDGEALRRTIDEILALRTPPRGIEEKNECPVTGREGEEDDFEWRETAAAGAFASGDL